MIKEWKHWSVIALADGGINNAELFLFDSNAGRIW